MATPADVAVRTSEHPRPRTLQRVRALNGHREGLIDLVRKERDLVRPAGTTEPVLPHVSLAWLAGVLVASALFLSFTSRRFFDLSGDLAEEL